MYGKGAATTARGLDCDAVADAKTGASSPWRTVLGVDLNPSLPSEPPLPTTTTTRGPAEESKLKWERRLAWCEGRGDPRRRDVSEGGFLCLSLGGLGGWSDA